ncbi:hypothetical protein CCB81_04300 [Armatimonadetes bacterium Uphvl-Ar2]|nr:hypothetical protein CCB81_04300 [Armatimonadetes bacterium Uphvl-Ar2]
MYDTLGRVGQKTLANGTSEHYAYDTRSRLTQVQLKQGATVLRTTGYAWDNADQITSQTVNGVTTNYGYDLAGQLTSEVRSGYNVAYTYDANGNRLSKTVNGAAESYTYDSADKMLTAGAKSYTYDAAGRTVGINAPGGTTTLTYDYESRVTAITGPGINETHTYNGLDTRVGTVQGGVSRTFVRDGSYVTDPVLRDGQATYTPGVSERRAGSPPGRIPASRTRMRRPLRWARLQRPGCTTPLGRNSPPPEPGRAPSAMPVGLATKRIPVASNSSATATTTRLQGGSFPGIQSRTGGIGIFTARMILQIPRIHKDLASWTRRGQRYILQQRAVATESPALVGILRPGTLRNPAWMLPLSVMETEAICVTLSVTLRRSTPDLTPRPPGLEIRTQLIQIMGDSSHILVLRA